MYDYDEIEFRTLKFYARHKPRIDLRVIEFKSRNWIRHLARRSRGTWNKLIFKQVGMYLELTDKILLSVLLLELLITDNEGISFRIRVIGNPYF